MATAIHHGPPGSFKTFTLIQRRAIPALQEGRAVVCNVRGFNDLDLIKAAYPEHDFPDTARIIWVDTTTQAGRRKMACWFHWVPFGALIIIDEAQQIYPDRRDFKLESLDRYLPEPGEFIEDIGLKEGRPEDVFIAYDKQRHYNWDIFLSTTNIAKVKKEIREVSEWAYRHRNMSGMMPWWKDRWREFQHDPETSGKSPSHFAGTPKDYRADRRVFNCYSSTATGLHSTTKTHESVFKDPKLRIVAFVMLLCFLPMGNWFYRHFIADKQPALPVPAAPAVPVQDSAQPSAVAAHAQSDGGHGAVASPALTLEHATFNLDPNTIRKLSILGVDQADIDRIPASCRMTARRVSCVFTASYAILNAATDYHCHDDVCTVHFFIKPPDEDKKRYPVTPSTVLANVARIP